MLQDRVDRNQIKDMEERYQCVKEEWESIDQWVIDSAIRDFHKILWACVAADGGYFKIALGT